MGKIRIKTLGIEELEQEQKRDAKKRKQAKEAKKMAKGAHGGERVVSMAPTEEELEKVEVANEEIEKTEEVKKTAEKKKEKKTAKQKKHRSKRYSDSLIQVDRAKRYALSEALELLKKLKNPSFDATVELHINTIEKGISGQVTLPHGTGKKRKIAIADASANGQLDKLLADIEKGNIDFDVLIAHPSAMPRLAKVAKILGPRGLMPNPKAGTISEKPQELAKKFEGGQVAFRTETQAPIIHAAVGKVSFSQKSLEENIASFVKAVGASKIRSVTLKSTMSPGIKIEFAGLS